MIHMMQRAKDQLAQPVPIFRGVSRLAGHPGGEKGCVSVHVFLGGRIPFRHDGFLLVPGQWMVTARAGKENVNVLLLILN